MKKYKLNTECNCVDCLEFRKLGWFYIKESAEVSDYIKYNLVSPNGMISTRLYKKHDIKEIPYMIDTSDIEKELDI